jgi:hypothetical protein
MTIQQLFPDRGDEQAGWNTLALLITVGISIVGGGVVGLSLGFFPRAKHHYTDENTWEVSADFENHADSQ